MNILLTREQVASLSAELCSAGHDVCHFPCYQTRALDCDSTVLQALVNLEQADMIIFISRAAVQYAMQAIADNQLHFPSSCSLAAIGSSTATELEKYAQQATIVPPTQFNSESLLALPQLQDCASKQITLIAGAGGRDLLAKTLQQRGAKVRKIEIYERVKPKQRLLASSLGPIDLIVVTSQTALENLIECADDQSLLKTKRCLVSSERLQSLVADKGFSQPALIAANASDPELLRAIMSYIPLALQDASF